MLCIIISVVVVVVLLVIQACSVVGCYCCCFYNAYLQSFMLLLLMLLLSFYLVQTYTYGTSCTVICTPTNSSSMRACYNEWCVVVVAVLIHFRVVSACWIQHFVEFMDSWVLNNYLFWRRYHAQENLNVSGVTVMATHDSWTQLTQGLHSQSYKT